jgi:DNA gyrase subunit B
MAKYTHTNIKVASGLEGVRHNATMYLGALGKPMLARKLKELVDNFYDEFGAGRNTGGEVFLNPDKDTYIVADYAGGIPVGMVKAEDDNGKSYKINSLTAVFSKLHAGGKGDQDAYKTSAGTHGVGSAAVNACCDSLEVWSFYGKVWHHQSFTQGKADFQNPKKSKPPKDVMQCLTQKKGYGTIIRIKPDMRIIAENSTRANLKKKSWKPTVTKLVADDIRQWLKDVAALNPGFKLSLSYISKKKLKSETFLNKDLKEIPKTICETHDLNTLTGGKTPFVLKGEYVTCAFVWTDHINADLFKSFVNSSPTIDHGTHVNGFKAALEKALKPFEPKAKAKSKGKAYQREDLMVGLTGFFEWRMHGASYSSQIKDRLESKVDKDVEEAIVKELTEYFDKNKTLAKNIIKRAIESKKQLEAFASVMRSVADVNKKARGAILPDVLTQAPTAKPEDRELYIVEGDSAGGTAVDARIPEFQEVLFLSGKPLNTVKASIDKIMNSKVTQSLLIAHGLSLNTDKKNKNTDAKLSTDKMRVGKTILMADADPDGYHIATMLIGFFWRFCPEYIEQGRLFVVDNPLFAANFKDKFYGGQTFEAVVEQMPKAAPSNLIGRLKGLGEMNSEMLGHFGMEPETRKLWRVMPPATKERAEWFTALVGDSSEAKRKLLNL